MTITTYAIGDVHGRADLLGALLSNIETAREPDSRIVFLGDIIDRGPQSREAMDIVVESLATNPSSQLILGNHEEFLLRFVDDDDNRDKVTMVWMRNGGIDTLLSYGVPLDSGADEAIQFLRENFSTHLATLRNAVTSVESDEYVLVHAGVEPGVSLSEQDGRKTRWIRQGFLDCRAPFPKTVVHGHTPTSSLRPEIHCNRIAIDTAAYHTGCLCCAVLKDYAPPAFLVARGQNKDIHVDQIEPVLLP